MIWPIVKSGELFSFVTSGSRGWAKHYSDTGPIFLRITNLDHDSISLDLRDVRRVQPPAGTEGTRTKVRPSDILISITADVGMVGLIPSTFGEAYINQHIALARPVRGVFAPYLAWCLASPSVQRQFRALQRGATKVGLGLDDIRGVDVPHPPFDEQRRIVAEIEKQFTRLDAAIRLLRNAQPRLKAWRVSLVHHAMTGRLVPTEAAVARASGERFEDASELIRRVTGSVHTGGQTTGSYPLPEGWLWAELGCIAELKGGLTKGQKRKAMEVTRPVEYLRVANVQRGYLDLSEMKQIDATEHEISELRLEVGDVLFNEGGDRDKLGRGWIWAGEVPECIHQNHVFRARLHSDLNPKFFSWFANYVGHRYFLEQGKQTTNLASINMSKLRRLPVPVAPVAEQQRIVAELERQLSVLEHVETSTEEQLLRATALRSGILRRAFIGELVQQTDSAEAVLS